MRVVDQLGSATNLIFLFGRLIFAVRSLVVSLLFFGFDFLDDDVVGASVTLVNRLRTVFLCLGEIDFVRHERAILLDDFARLVLVTKLQTVIRQMERHSCTDFLFGARTHFKGGGAVAAPVYSLGAFFV